jgi:hypothetical protein
MECFMTVSNRMDEEGKARKRNLERRRAARLPPSAIPFLKSVKLVAGPEVKLINVSRGGALIESEARLSPGSAICVRLVTGESIYLLKGRVLRARAVALSGAEIRYHIAVAFDQEFTVVARNESSMEELAPPRGGDSGQSPEQVLQPESEASENSEIVTVTAEYLEPDKNLKRIFEVNDW